LTPGRPRPHRAQTDGPQRPDRRRT